MTKQWFTPSVGHNSRVASHLGQVITTREYGDIPGIIQPLTIPHQWESMPGIGADKFCAALEKYLAG